MPTAYIVDAVRTAGGRRGGRLAGVHPVDLAAAALDHLVGLTGIDPAGIEDVIMAASARAVSRPGRSDATRCSPRACCRNRPRR